MKTPVLFLIILFLFAGCDKDHDDNAPKSANFTVTIENVAQVNDFIASGTFNTPEGKTDPGPAKPGYKYVFSINAGKKQSLSFACMLAATNDLFFGPDNDGIALYDGDGNPISGDVTEQVYLWDAGTEVNEEPAVGPNTVTNQSGPNTGEDENGNVMLIDEVTNGFQFDYPDVSEIIKVSITHTEGTEFEVSIEDLPSAMLETSKGEVPAPISPGVWVTHNGENPLYTPGMPDLGQGIEAIAEDGNIEPLANYVAEHTGVTYPISPGVWVVHSEGTSPLFSEGNPDYGDGVEAIAEDGNVSVLEANLGSLEGEASSGVFNTPMDGSSPGPLLPGSKYVFSFQADENQALSFVSMLAATNDVFLGTSDTGIALFDSTGQAISGDITDELNFWDAGTELNEQPAVGPNTVTNQSAPNTGIDEDQPVRLLSDVNDGFDYPAVNEVVKVSITTN